ncbi:monooxygenase FAD-binding protein [Halothece sp. PCC 7418]|uniref:FAD-dependent oxidoreductase n=1 Tax=Halothece sp. (strain PCC 7418) TaxID=65093 RepID=UPI0002A076AC|nr:NAD(P)/FAD-dependent oxidoreductase [Halothece sp. PCC 7418]AFZ42495.1 monooxygenase FAD-binding protein [Halothece sp. PCC 7418]
MTVNSVYDVLIIGAGPVGLATAVGLYQRGIQNLLIIDQTRAFRQAGQTVDLLPNGLKALRSLSNEAYEKCKFVAYAATSNSTWKRRNLQGEVSSSVSINFDDWFQAYGEGRISLPWYEIQTQLRQLLPSEKIKVNTRCVNVKEENNLVAIDCIVNQPSEKNPFAHWNDSTQTIQTRDEYESVEGTIKAKLVLAADGINSTVRKLLYENTALEKWAKPQYSGYGAIGCLSVENIPDETVEGLETNYLQRDRVVTVTPEENNSNSRIILLRKDTNTFGYLLHFPVQLDVMLNSSRNELINLAVETLKAAGYPPAFSQLVQLSNPEQLITRPYYIHPANIPVKTDKIWSQGRVALVGDSAHGMPPFNAQGTNQGFEDALVIVKQLIRLFKNKNLDDQAAIDRAFQEYEKERRPFMEKMQTATMNSHRWTQADWTEYGQQVYSRHLSLE